MQKALIPLLCVVAFMLWYFQPAVPVPDLAPPVPYIAQPSTQEPERSVVKATENKNVTTAVFAEEKQPQKKSMWTPYNQYGDLARKTGKPVFVYFDGGPSCQACERFKRNVLTDEAVACLLREDFICVKLQGESEFKQWKIGEAPVVMFVKNGGILRLKGERSHVAPQDVAEFLKLLDKALKS